MADIDVKFTKEVQKEIAIKTLIRLRMIPDEANIKTALKQFDFALNLATQRLNDAGIEIIHISRQYTNKDNS